MKIILAIVLAALLAVTSACASQPAPPSSQSSESSSSESSSSSSQEVKPGELPSDCADFSQEGDLGKAVLRLKEIIPLMQMNTYAQGSSISAYQAVHLYLNCYPISIEEEELTLPVTTSEINSYINEVFQLDEQRDYTSLPEEDIFTYNPATGEIDCDEPLGETPLVAVVTDYQPLDDSRATIVVGIYNSADNNNQSNLLGVDFELLEDGTISILNIY